MSKQVGGVLAIRHGWCRPDEVIRLAVPCDRGSIRFDVRGLSWDGEVGGRAVAEGIGRAVTVMDDLVNSSSEYESGPSAPKVVYFGPSPQSQIMHAAAATQQLGTHVTWVLTSHRLALLEEVPETEEAGADSGEASFWGKARKFGAGVRDFSRDVADILQDKKLGSFEPNAPIPVAGVAVRAEFPSQQVRSVRQATRRLPAMYSLGSVPVLQIELGDGSGLEVVAVSNERAARLQAMAFGHQ